MSPRVKLEALTVGTRVDSERDTEGHCREPPHPPGWASGGTQLEIRKSGHGWELGTLGDQRTGVTGHSGSQTRVNGGHASESETQGRSKGGSRWRQRNLGL
jgi:hypothetical protein